MFYLTEFKSIKFIENWKFNSDCRTLTQYFEKYSATIYYILQEQDLQYIVGCFMHSDVPSFLMKHLNVMLTGTLDRNKFYYRIEMGLNA